MKETNNLKKIIGSIAAVLAVIGGIYGKDALDTPNTYDTVPAYETVQEVQVETMDSSNEAMQDVSTENQDLADETTQDASAEKTTPAYRFYKQSYLMEHYEKHGIDMGFDSPEAYEAAASAVVENPDSLHKLEKEDGDDVYYLESTNEFVIVSTSGFIRTYFKPDRGKAYFDKQ